MKKWTETLLSHLFYGYLKIIKKTSRLSIVGEELFSRNNIAGFWHEDSYTMILLLDALCSKGADISVVVTADPRGECVSYMVEKSGGSTVRMHDGIGSRTSMKTLRETACISGKSVALAMDGPLGPRHVPKKISFFLSQLSQKEFIGIRISYSRKIALVKRWDHYVIPLPFSKITVYLENYGVVSKSDPPAVKTMDE